MRMVSLPRGGQKGIRGAAVNVPADLGPVCSLLPRLPDDAHTVPLNLKWKLEYRHAYIKVYLCFKLTERKQSTLQVD